MALKSAMRTTLKLNCNFYNFRLPNLPEAKVLNTCLGVSEKRLLHTCSPLLKKEMVSIVIDRGGQELVVKGKVGDSILDTIVKNEVDIKGYGACEGTLSCSTCHVQLSSEDFQKLPVSASDEELDMLDMAPDVCSTSRLGCQIILSKALDGLRVKIPSEVKDMRHELPIESNV